MADSRTLNELEEQYPASSRMRLFNFMNISMMLGDSIITKDYQVPIPLASAIELTTYGKDISDQARRRQVPYNDIRMLCLLEIFNADLVDIEKTNEEAIIKIVDKQIRDRELLFPFTNGRLLYDKYFESHSNDTASYLTPEETLRLLAGIPQGIAQYGQWVTGPYGLIRSQSSRLITADRNIPVRHCPDPSCTAIHHTFLATSKDASVNKSRERFTKLLEREDGASQSETRQGKAWTRFVNNISDDFLSVYSDDAIEPVIVLIGDALADGELRKLFNYLLEQPDTNLRELTFKVATSASPPSAADLNRAQLLQLIMSVGNIALTAAIDQLVSIDEIVIPFGEIRRPVINRRVRFGLHGLHAELGSYGVRVVASGSSLAPLRARSLVEHMYRLDDEADRQELDWQLRDEPSDSLEAKLEHYLQTRDPRSSIGTLVLARRSNAVVATTSLGIGDVARTADDDLVNSILWKLGFSIHGSERLHDQFWRSHDAMLQHARRGVTTSAPADREEIRRLAVTYFTSLETLLNDSLAYTTWALCTDHYLSSKPFVYRPHIDMMKAFETLNQQGGRVSNSERLSKKNTLYPLTRGFGRLAELLASYDGSPEQKIRSKDDLPEWVGVQSLERFPFIHTTAFLDLLPDCRASILRVLTTITDRFVAADITTTRNDWLHGSRSGSAANLDRLREGLEDVREAVLSIEENGFSRQIFDSLSDLVDGDGRRTAILANNMGRQVHLFGPSPFAWLRLPGLRESQYVMNAARFAEPTECLRFTVEVESEYSKMWDNFPKRPILEQRRSLSPQLPLSA